MLCRRRRVESDVADGQSAVSSAHVPAHAARVVVQMVAVGALELRSAVHHLVTVHQLRVRVAVRTVRTSVDRRLAAPVVAQYINVRLLRTENTPHVLHETA